jgi:hypothetical protein
MAYPNWIDLISDAELDAQIVAATELRAVEDATFVMLCNVKK